MILFSSRIRLLRCSSTSPSRLDSLECCLAGSRDSSCRSRENHCVGKTINDEYQCQSLRWNIESVSVTSSHLLCPHSAAAAGNCIIGTRSTHWISSNCNCLHARQYRHHIMSINCIRTIMKATSKLFHQPIMPIQWHLERRADILTSTYCLICHD